MTAKLYALDYEFNTGEMNTVVSIVDDPTEADRLARQFYVVPIVFVLLCIVLMYSKMLLFPQS